MARYSCVVVAVFFALTSSLTAFADVIYAIGDASTSAFAQGNVTGATARGWEFKVNDDNVQVVQLGVNAWTDGTPLTLTLWNDDTQTLLAQTSVISSAQNWVYTSLDTPVALTSGKLYSVIAWADVTDAWYLFNNDPPAAFTPTGTIEFIQSMYSNNSDANTFPGNPIFPPEQYGVTDIGYIVPEPCALALISLGALGLLARRSFSR